MLLSVAPTSEGTSFAISIFLAYLALEFFVPLKLRNGQTIGKKVFGIGVMRTGSIKINAVSLFIRTVLGKYTIETMIPVLISILIFFGAMGVVGIAIMALLFIVQVCLLFGNGRRAVIHDLLADSVTVDLASQMIFDTEADLLAYKQKLHSEKAARQSY